MRILFLFFVMSLTAGCVAVDNPRETYFQNPRNGKVKKCTQTYLDDWYDAQGICEKSNKKHGLVEVVVVEYDRAGNPLIYEKKKNHLWPDN